MTRARRRPRRHGPSCGLYRVHHVWCLDLENTKDFFAKVWDYQVINTKLRFFSLHRFMFHNENLAGTSCLAWARGPAPLLSLFPAASPQSFALLGRGGAESSASRASKWNDTERLCHGQIGLVESICCLVTSQIPALGREVNGHSHRMFCSLHLARITRSLLVRVPLKWRDGRAQWQNPCDTKRLLSLLVIRAINRHRKVQTAEHSTRMSVDSDLSAAGVGPA